MRTYSRRRGASDRSPCQALRVGAADTTGGRDQVRAALGAYRPHPGQAEGRCAIAARAGLLFSGPKSRPRVAETLKSLGVSTPKQILGHRRAGNGRLRGIDTRPESAFRKPLMNRSNSGRLSMDRETESSSAGLCDHPRTEAADGPAIAYARQPTVAGCSRKNHPERRLPTPPCVRCCGHAPANSAQTRRNS